MATGQNPPRLDVGRPTKLLREILEVSEEFETHVGHELAVNPTDLQAIGLAMDQLGARAAQVQPLFVTLDPERDTAEHLAQYVPMFHPKLIGLTGSPAAVHEAAEAYRVYYKRVEFENKTDYTVDHSAFIYLMDRDGKYLGFFPPGTSADQIVGMIKPHLGPASAK